MASLDSWLLHTEETNNTGDETESDESEPQPRQAKSRRVDYVMLCYVTISLIYKEEPTIKSPDLTLIIYYIKLRHIIIARTFSNLALMYSSYMNCEKM